MQGILDNDFYIGTLRQGKYTRKKINDKDVRRDEIDHIVLKHHHQATLDYRTFAIVRALRESRSTALPGIAQLREMKLKEAAMKVQDSVEEI